MCLFINGISTGLNNIVEDNNLGYNNQINIITIDQGWYNYSPLPNYAPSGMPDFDQKQNNWRDHEGYLTFCGPVALANVLWYIDSMYSDYNGTPGDGKDECYIVRDYFAPGELNPGPNTDDSSFIVGVCEQLYVNVTVTNNIHVIIFFMTLKFYNLQI